ncbi:MAG: hypothetical protein KDE22_14215 [Rhodobacterales bacterium]|nr:hypothetical protein [Rhodobacterales bacterium]
MAVRDAAALAEHRPGTVVAARFGFYKHVGIVSDRWDRDGPMVISNSKRSGHGAEEGMRLFAAGTPVRIVGFPGTLPPDEVLARARAVMTRPYDLLTWNCEHFIRHAHGLPRYSPQMRAAMGIGLAVAGTLMVVGRRRL